jgi:tetratricopeptide (TPR) repeat protein
MRAVIRVITGCGASSAEPSGQTGRVLDRLARAPFVGRDRELGSLLAALEEATAGRGQLRLVVGEPGIGKTRLAKEVTDRAARGGALALWGRCWEDGGSPAYWPWIQIVRTYSRNLDGPTIAAKLGQGAPYIAQIVPDVREKLSPIPVPPLLDVEQARFRLFDAMGSFLGRVAEAQPLVLVLDDLHTADHTSLLLLQFIARQLHALPILVVATYRDAEIRRTAAAEHVLGELAREGQRIRLTGLVRNEVERFIRETTGSAPAATLVRSITEMTQGNPFFIDEIVRLRVAEERTQSRGRCPLARFRVPDEVRKAIRRRLEHLGNETRDLLTGASVIGRVFDIALLQRLSALPVERIVELLADAEAADILTEVAGTLRQYAFAHALVRETLYQDLTPALRAQIHGRVGEILEARHARDPEHLGALAHHFYQAAVGGVADKAVAYQTEAGKRALDVLAYEEAAEHFERALQALELGGEQEPKRCDLLLMLAEAQEKAGERSSARAAFTSAAALARKLRNPELLARAALGMAPGFVGLTLSSGTVDAEVVGLLEEALALTATEGSPLRARLLGRLAIELYWSSAPERRADLSLQAVEMARRTGDVSALAFALSARHVALWAPENVHERLETARCILRLAKDLDDPEMALRGRIGLLTDLLELGDLDTADGEFEDYRRGAEKLGQPLYLWFSATWRAMRAGLEGRFEDADRLAAEALGIGRQLDDPDASQAFTCQMIAFRAGRGLSELLSATTEVVDRSGDAPAWRSALALIFCDQGLESEARREFERLAAIDFADIPRNADWLVTLFNLAQVCCFLLDHKRAATLYDLLLPFADRCVVARSALVCLGSVSRALAMLAGTTSRWPEAETHFERALQVNERLGARPLVALTHLAYAMMLLARSQSDDQDRALDHLADARTTAEALRMDVLAQWIEPLAGFADSSRPKTASKLEYDEPQGDTTQDAPTAGMAVFRDEGDCWAVGFGGQLVRVKAAAGFRYTVLLLRSPGVAFQATELIEAAGRAHGEARLPMHAIAHESASFGRITTGLGDAGESLDRRAAAEYRRRLDELRDELDEARRFNDKERAARHEKEIEFLRTQLVRDLGLGGRARRAGSHAERARISVTRAIDRTLSILHHRMPSLGRYLETTIKTGTFCSYTPDPRFQISWEL